MFSLFHPDAPLSDSGMGSCFACHAAFVENVEAVAGIERNARIFFRRHDREGKILAKYEQIAPDFELTPATIRFVVRAIWRKLNARHIHRCLKVSWP